MRLNVSLSPHEYIHHILDEIDYILTQISDMDYDSFVRRGCDFDADGGCGQAPALSWNMP